MAKVAASKKKAPSKHSRAARRATSPGIDTDKSLKNVKRPVESIDSRPSVLAVHQGAGISKKSKQGRKAVMSTKARKRHEKDLERAEAIVERTALKVQKSKGQARKVQSVRKTWDEVNSEVSGAISGRKDMVFPDAADSESEESDEEMVEKTKQPTVRVEASSISVPRKDGDGDEDIS